MNEEVYTRWPVKDAKKCVLLFLAAYGRPRPDFPGGKSAGGFINALFVGSFFSFCVKIGFAPPPDGRQSQGKQRAKGEGFMAQGANPSLKTKTEPRVREVRWGRSTLCANGKIQFWGTQKVNFLGEGEKEEEGVESQSEPVEETHLLIGNLREENPLKGRNSPKLAKIWPNRIKMSENGSMGQNLAKNGEHPIFWAIWALFKGIFGPNVKILKN